MEETLYRTLLFDFYGELLPDRQKRIYEMYYLEDFSLSEVAVNVGISRQGVRDNVGRCMKMLNDFENRLGLIADYQRRKKNCAEFCEKIDVLASVNHDCERTDNCRYFSDLTRFFAELKNFLSCD